MRDTRPMALGLILIGLGVIFLLGIWLQINIWGFVWPVLLIGLGVIVIVRSRSTAPGTRSDFVVLADIEREGEWAVLPEETWIGVGDVELDLTRATIPAGETILRFRGFVGDVSVTVPASVGLAVQAGGFVTTAKVQGRSQDSFLAPYQFKSDGYDAAERKVRVESAFFVHELKIKQV